MILAPSTPYVLIDELLRLEPQRVARARMRFRPEWDVFADHFPGMPIVPGALLTEAMAQTSGWLIAAGTSFGRWPMLIMIRDAKFRRPVLPDEPIEIEVTLQSHRDDLVETSARAEVAGGRVAAASLVFQLRDLAAEHNERLERWVRDTFARLNGPVALASAIGDRVIGEVEPLRAGRQDDE
jgi:3-hydroxymyristoyl/3-hydroxydecanoyl-(acyl carrier protein) dehydratase